jgi:2-dehydropantoate 2-reductase
MKVLIVGSGAVGCALGSSLMKSGQDVTFFARGKNLDALQTQGLTFDWPSESWRFEKVKAIDSSAAGEKFDVLLFCVKGYDWKNAVSAIEAFPSQFVLTFQNGVSVHRELREKIGNRVFAAAIYVVADRVAPGHVISRSVARVVVDGRSEIRDPMKQLRDALTNPNLNAQLSDEMETDLWRKYLFLCSFSAVNTLTEKTAGPILTDPATRNLLAQYMGEIVQVANAAGCQLSQKDIDTVFENSSRYPPTTTSSLFADYKRKQMTEVELLQGDLVRMADHYKIAVPVARAIYALLKVKTAHE